MELALLWRGGRRRAGGLVPELSLLHPLCEANLLPRAVAVAGAAGASKSQDTRYLDIREDAELDEAQLVSWIKQASKLPGEKM